MRSESKTLEIELTPLSTVMMGVVLLIGLLLYVHLGLIAAETPGEFTAIELEPGNVTVDEQEALDVAATIQNTGERTATQTVTLSCGESEKRVSLTLDPGETETVQLRETAGDTLELGENTCGVATEDDRLFSTIVVESDRPSHFAVTDLQPSDLSSLEGDRVINVSGQITNTGGSADVQTVELRINNETRIETVVALSPNESESVDVRNLDLGWLEPGTYTYSIHTENGSVRGTVTIPEPRPSVEGDDHGRFEITSVEPANTTVERDGSFNVTATIENTGEWTATRTVELRLNDRVRASVSMTLRPGETREFDVYNLSVAGFGPGAYEYYVVTEEDTKTSVVVIAE